MVMQTADGRVRAWILVRTEKDPVEVATALYDDLGHEGGNEWVVVRADVVVDYEYSIVVPVDAVNDDALWHVDEMIRGRTGVDDTVVLRVQNHKPLPPHDANGYITTHEVELGKEFVKPGRQGNSPGLNPWG